MRCRSVGAKIITFMTPKAILATLGKEIFNLRFQRASGQLENTARVRQARRHIARIKTILGERSRQAPSATGARSQHA